MSLENTAYSFLSFYKIVNLHKPKSDRQRRWLKRKIEDLEKINRLSSRIKEIRSNGEDPGEYLYKSCRCAVAHADVNNITYDPENIDDEIRLDKDKPLIMHLAKLIIENEFLVKSLHTVFEEHLYEISGFYSLLDDGVLSKLKAAETISRRSIKFPNKFSLRIFGITPLPAFENLMPRILKIHGGKIELSLSDNENLITVLLMLDFINEKLIFDLNNIRLSDNGTQKAANFIADTIIFEGKYIANGELEIWNSDDNKILGRLDPFFPVNAFYVGDEALFKEESRWRKIAKTREKSKASTGRKK